MVKIPLKIEQINTLLNWRDKHKDLVRNCSIVFPECEIISENGIKFRVSKDNIKPFCFNFIVSDTIQHKIMGRFSINTMTKIIVHGLPQLSAYNKQSALTVWATVQAYILHFEPKLIHIDDEIHAKNKDKTYKASSARQKRTKNIVLYLNPIKFISDSKNATQHKYTPPSCAFSVRGHYRKLKSGKSVYVHSYEKNTSKCKDNRNKIVKIMEV